MRAAVPAVHAADPGAPVLIGELAPIGEAAHRAAGLPARLRAASTRAYRPVAPRPLPLRFRPAGRRRLRPPPARPARLADQRVLEPGLGEDRRARPARAACSTASTSARRILAPGDRFDLWLTEFGYQTNPPDGDDGVSLAPPGRAGCSSPPTAPGATRAIRSLTLYQWEDEPTYRRNPGGSPFAGWQSGLRFVDGRAKPALHGVRVPFVVDRDRGRVWGQVRPGGAHTVTLQRRAGGAWTPIGGPDRHRRPRRLPDADARCAPATACATSGDGRPLRRRAGPGARRQRAAALSRATRTAGRPGRAVS